MLSSCFGEKKKKDKVIFYLFLSSSYSLSLFFPLFFLHLFYILHEYKNKNRNKNSNMIRYLAY